MALACRPSGGWSLGNILGCPVLGEVWMSRGRGATDGIVCGAVELSQATILPEEASKKSGPRPCTDPRGTLPPGKAGPLVCSAVWLVPLQGSESEACSVAGRPLPGTRETWEKSQHVYYQTGDMTLPSPPPPPKALTGTMKTTACTLSPGPRQTPWSTCLEAAAGVTLLRMGEADASDGPATSP